MKDVGWPLHIESFSFEYKCNVKVSLYKNSTYFGTKVQLRSTVHRFDKLESPSQSARSLSPYTDISHNRQVACDRFPKLLKLYVESTTYRNRLL